MTKGFSEWFDNWFISSNADLTIREIAECAFNTGSMLADLDRDSRTMQGAFDKWSKRTDDAVIHDVIDDRASVPVKLELPEEGSESDDVVCCADMDTHLVAGEVAIIYSYQHDAYGIEYKHGTGEGFQVISYCPWCGRGHCSRVVE